MMPKGRAAWAAMCLEECQVIKLNLSFFHQVGSQLGRLTSLPIGASRLEIAMATGAVEGYVRTLLTNSNIPLKVCRTQGQQVLDAINATHQKMRAYASKASPSAGSPEEWNQPPTYQDIEFHGVLSAARNFEIVLQAELDALATYYVGRKGIYDTDWLIQAAEQALPEGMLQYLDPKTIEDMRSSGRCLALDVPTASGFHILRATESILHRYHLAVCNPEKTKPLGSWSAYLSELYKASGEKTVTDPEVREVYHILTRIKDHRNNVMHPEWELTQDQAFTLFEKC